MSDKKTLASDATLRDYFATRAPPMPSSWADRTRSMATSNGRIDVRIPELERLTSWRYAYADAMMSERAK